MSSIRFVCNWQVAPPLYTNGVIFSIPHRHKPIPEPPDYPGVFFIQKSATKHICFIAPNQIPIGITSVFNFIFSFCDTCFLPACSIPNIWFTTESYHLSSNLSIGFGKIIKEFRKKQCNRPKRKDSSANPKSNIYDNENNADAVPTPTAPDATIAASSIPVNTLNFFICFSSLLN